jgi:hypothetical protein
MITLSHGGYNIYRGWEPLVPWLPRQPIWAGPNTNAGDGPTAPMTNTIIIL